MRCSWRSCAGLKRNPGTPKSGGWEGLPHFHTALIMYLDALRMYYCEGRLRFDVWCQWRGWTL